jgi:hypothetical protein
MEANISFRWKPLHLFGAPVSMAYEARWLAKVDLDSAGRGKFMTISGIEPLIFSGAYPAFPAVDTRSSFPVSVELVTYFHLRLR